ncbi:hypothetical protein AAVH_20240 [Aphelenchoides avenae]|nr:hypothetical protein AAVH_20240 [Aphelenchus avenae]
MDAEQALNYAYYDVNSPACYSGVERVYAEALRHCPTINRSDVRAWLKRQRTYTLYRPTARKFTRLRTVPTGLNTDWQADLTLFNALKDYNDGFKYILVCVDVLSRMVYAQPVREKSAAHMRPAFEAILERAGVQPWKLFTDRGLEFESREMRQFFHEKDILKFCAYTNKVQKAAVVERMNRTIKERLYKFFSQRNTLRWLDVLQRIVYAINHSVCRMTGMRPVDVTEENAPALRRRLYEPLLHAPDEGTRYLEGDTVRIIKKKALFTKGLAPFSDVIYTVGKVLNRRRPVVYRLKDHFGDYLKGYFYEKELVPTAPFNETTTRIRRVIQRRTDQNGRRMALVEWLNHPATYNSWVDINDFGESQPAADQNLQEDTLAQAAA